jgi:hypothetical protein
MAKFTLTLVFRLTDHAQDSAVLGKPCAVPVGFAAIELALRLSSLASATDCRGL